MKRDQLIRDVSDRLGVPEHSAQVFLHAFFDAAKTALRTGDPLRIDGLGHWIPSLHDDGTLKSIEYIPVAAEATATPAQGPVSSNDAMHFIPAAALEKLSMRQNAPVDVADLVDEVQRLFTSGNGHGSEQGDSADDSVSAADAHAAMESLQAEAPLRASGAEADESQATDASAEPLPEDTLNADDDADAPAAFPQEKTAPSPEDGIGDHAVEAPSYEENDDVPEATPMPDSASTATYASDLPPDADMPDADMPDADMPDADMPDADMPDADMMEMDEEEEDNEVFYRNRDQLYHPPQERNTRPLLIVALVLTAVMIVIVLSMIFGEDERPEVPGTGESGLRIVVTDGRPISA